MKRICLALAVAAGALPAWAQTNVGVSVEVNQPGVYGRIDIGRIPQAPAPVVIYPQPVVIAPTPVAVVQQPIYLHVPPGHAKNWGKHCHRYSACGQPVYFVQEQWYQQHYRTVQHHHYHHGRDHDDDDHKRHKHHGKKHKHDD